MWYVIGDVGKEHLLIVSLVRIRLSPALHACISLSSYLQWNASSSKRNFDRFAWGKTILEPFVECSNFVPILKAIANQRTKKEKRLQHHLYYIIIVVHLVLLTTGVIICPFCACTNVLLNLSQNDNALDFADQKLSKCGRHL